jgi:hypothetical protein
VKPSRKARHPLRDFVYLIYFLNGWSFAELRGKLQPFLSPA